MSHIPSHCDPACVPRATYRLQFHRGFTLRDARALVPFLDELGVSHLYASPLFQATPGSTHGYDVCDFSRLNSELGTEADFAALVTALRERNMGLVLDVVPNHAAAVAENPWWWDVLLHGPASAFADFFDIDWNPPGARLRGKVLLPVLGEELDEVLKSGAFVVRLERGQAVLHYFSHRFPLVLSPAMTRQRTLTEFITELNRSPHALGEVLRQQHYVLTHWRRGDAEVNYRRFFNISSLAGLRVEAPAVFAAVHERVRRWHADGWLAGLRVDHIDGLRDPADYLHRLRAAAPGAWLVVEKILGSHEDLPADWPVEGTTGYDFLNRVTALFIDPAGEGPLTEFYGRFTGQPTDYAVVLRDAQRLVLRELLVAEVNRLVRLLVQCVTRHWRGDPLAEPQLRDALIEVLVAFPVYRSYLRPGAGGMREEDELRLTQALEAARHERPDLPPVLFDFITDLLLLRWEGEVEWDFVLRFQQLSGPVMAKGAEDTACYRYNRLLALNTVGGEPGQFGAPPERFHLASQHAQRSWPHAMLATSTHDTKRGEDVRARLCLLSEIPEAWARTVELWAGINQRYRSGQFPDRNLEYFYYQTLVGAWPLSLDRALVVMEKAACEAKQHTSWSARNADYDRSLREFITHTLGDPRFLTELNTFVGRLVEPGYVNSLAQVLLKLTTPGVPDIYQGNVLWDLSLVDPDNRRPVDFDHRELALAAMREMTVADVWHRRAEGFPKLWVIQKTLQARHRHPEWFGPAGGYAPLAVRGTKARHAVAFERGQNVVVIVPRLVIGLGGDWADTHMALPAGEWRDEFAGAEIVGGEHRLAELLNAFPVALLTRKEKLS